MHCIDFHTHFDSNKYDNIFDAYNFLSSEASKNNFNKIVALQLLSQKWSREEIGELIPEFKNVITFVDINPKENDAVKKLEIYISKYHYFGLKLHPRLNNFKICSEETYNLVNAAGSLKIPVVIDCFPDGNSIIDGFKTSDYGELARKCNNTNIVAAHMGGIYALEMMLIAKRCPNLYLSIAYTFLYFRNSSITKDIIYSINSLGGKKIFYGSDYPDRGLRESFDLTINEINKYDKNNKYINNLFYSNANDFLNIYENF